jgi:phosphatidylglycerophosphatase C
VPRLVFFDLDGTITRRDTLTSWVFGYALRRPWRLLGLVGVLPALLRFLAGRADHGALKGALIRGLARGSTRAEIAAWNERFLPRLFARGLLEPAVAAIRAHRDAGDRLVLMSASVDLYVPQIARRLGFDETICSSVRWSGDRLDGTLATPNRRGEEKARCLRECAARHPGLQTVAYGNSAPDLPHLSIADRGVLVNAGQALTERACGGVNGARIERGKW